MSILDTYVKHRATMKLLVVLLLPFFIQHSSTEWVKEMENENLYQGDIVLSPDQRNPDGSLNYAASTKGRLWPNGVVPYSIHYSLKNEKEALDALKQAIADYHKYTCIRFVPRTDQSSYINFYNGIGCNSPVGHHPGQTNDVSIGKGCWKKGVIMHEMGHSMGFWHEQSRGDRDKYIEILWDNIMPSMKYNFQKESDVSSLDTPYDLSSMMHYGTTSFSRNGHRSIKVRDYSKRLLIGQRRGFSNLDVLQLNRMYKCPVYKGTVPPKVCKDKPGYPCAKKKKIGYCTNPMAEGAMYGLCCETCFGEELRGKQSHTYPPKTAKPTLGPGGKCVDVEKKSTCDYYVRQGYCKSPLKALRDLALTKCCASCRRAG